MHNFTPLILALMPALSVANDPGIDIQSAREQLRKSEASLDQALKTWHEASGRLRQMADCEYNDKRGKDLAEMSERSRAVQAASAKLKASLRKIEVDGTKIFAAPIQADACAKGPTELREKLVSLQLLIKEELKANFPKGKPTVIEEVARKSIPSLHTEIQKYQKWNCHQPKGMLELVGKEACRRYKSCSRGEDPQAVYNAVLQHMEKTKSLWVAQAGSSSQAVQEALNNVASAVAAKDSSLAALANRCGSMETASTAGSRPSANIPAEQKNVRTQASVASRPADQPSASLKESPKSETSKVVGEVLRDIEEKSRLGEAEPVRSDAWSPPDWAAYDRYKESIGAPNIVRGVDLDNEYASFLATNQIQVRSVEDALRLQRAINASSIYVNGPESNGPSVYQDGVIGQRTKSAIFLMQSDSAYRDVFLRELRREGLQT